ncbi:ent-kaurene synthase [Pyronema omphalodes]|nr:ent-kaurene synthase [Pyronema omphalodes]
MNVDLHTTANAVLHTLSVGYDPKHGFGAMSNSNYDTAWVSMIKHPLTGSWLFPECFHRLLACQSDRGCWNGNPSDEFSVILNTLAGLLAVKKHIVNTLPSDPESAKFDKPMLLSRLTRAIAFLNAALEKWNPDETLHVGFEFIVPGILDLLRKDGIDFQFPGLIRLKELREKKLAVCKPQLLYKRSLPTLHSLEAFVGLEGFDFNKIKHHLTNGSMMASPSSTAAYLMNVDEWDTEAEEYLRFVIERGRGTEDYGGLPSAFPSTFFEFSWVVENLLENGFDVGKLDGDSLDKIRGILEKGLIDGKGLLGFAPGLMPDSDDTSKSLVVLNRLGVHGISPDSLIAEFGKPDRFKTYSFERNPSFTANCNVLKALLQYVTPEKNYATQIETCVRFISQYWWNSWEALQDKWSLSMGYPIMVMSQALVKLYSLWEQDLLPQLPSELMQLQLPVVLMQGLTRTLYAQNANGSWGHLSGYEETAYSVLTLANISSLPFTKILDEEIKTAILRGRTFLRSADIASVKGDWLWIEKTTYRSQPLAQSYFLGALQCKTPTMKLGPKVEELFTAVSAPKIEKFSTFWGSLPVYAGVPQWNIKASLVEAYLFLPQLKAIRLEVFDREGLLPERYLEYIPFTWTGASNKGGTFASAQLLYDMMVVSLLNYQADEYMEHETKYRYQDNLSDIGQVIRGVFESFANNLSENDDTNQDAFPRHLRTFTKAALQHPRVVHANDEMKSHLFNEIHIFFKAHHQQAVDNLQLAAQITTPKKSFHTWVRGVSAQHTSAHYSYAFYHCLAAHAGEKYQLTTVQQKYISQDVIMHLASLCRMYNDYGSLQRDQDETNVNSMMFPEFRRFETDVEKKKELLKLTQYERRCLELALDALEMELKSDGKERFMRLIKMFCDVTDTYGWVYVVRDIGTRT